MDRTSWLPPSPTRPRLQQFPEPCQREGGAQPDSSFSQYQVAAGATPGRCSLCLGFLRTWGGPPRAHARLCTCARSLSLCHLRPHLSSLSTACVSLVSDPHSGLVWPAWPARSPATEPALACILACEKAPAPSKKVPDVSLTGFAVKKCRGSGGEQGGGNTLAGFPGWGPAPVTWERRPPAQPLPPGSPSGGHQSQTAPSLEPPMGFWPGRHQRVRKGKHSKCLQTAHW